MIQVAYTNSNCSDLWAIFQKQTKKNCNLPLYFISDLIPNNINSGEVYIYDNNIPYYKVWIDALNKFKSEYFIYLQEDFFLYSEVNEEVLKSLQKFLVENKDYSFVRLIKSGDLGTKKIQNNLYEIESTNVNIFAMQATIWRTEDYIKLMNLVKEEKWLENQKYTTTMKSLGMKGVYYYNNEPKRGLAHYDSSVYPYIATALVKGKWNLSEYNLELGKILEINNININKRGIF